MKKFILLVWLGGITCSYAQNEVDALRYSRLTFGGTARFSSMCGAFGALGGDLSALSYNPAGIGIYRRSEFSFTPSIYGQYTTSSYNGTLSEDSKLNFNFGNAGIVWTPMATDRTESGWMSYSFAFGYNRTGNFHGRMDIRGDNTESSLLDTWVNTANGYHPDELDPFTDQLAFDAVLLDTLSGPDLYGDVIPYGSMIEQVKSIETRGSTGESYFAFGGNYMNRIYLGASIGFPTIRYSEESAYSEYDNVDSIPVFESYTYNYNLYTRGSGFNFKFGMIFRPSDWIRIGGSVHSPSFFSMSDDYSSNIKAYYTGYSPVEAESPQGEFRYRLTTPMRIVGSLGFIIGKYGLLGVDYEYADYATARLSASPNVFGDANTAARRKYREAGNIRIGGEARLDPFSLRAGYALYGSPYDGGINEKAVRTSFSAGFGIRNEDYFIDIAYVHSRSSEKYYLYDTSLLDDSSYLQPAENNFFSSSFMLTLGFRY